MSERTAVVITGVVVTALGCSVILNGSSRASRMGSGLARCSILVGLMSLVCTVGLRAYQAQEAAIGTPSELPNPAVAPPGARFSPAYGPAIRIALLQEVPLLVLTALMLDGGGSFRVCSIAVLAHWAATLLIIARRPRAPTQADLALIRYGFWAGPFVVCAIAPLIWRATGQA